MCQVDFHYIQTFPVALFETTTDWALRVQGSDPMAQMRGIASTYLVDHELFCRSLYLGPAHIHEVSTTFRSRTYLGYPLLSGH